MSPKYTHNCERCRFLGQVEEEGKIVDLYWCPSATDLHLDSLIARFSDEGPDYASYHPPDAFAYPEQAAKQLGRHAHYHQLMVRGIQNGLYRGRVSYMYRST